MAKTDASHQQRPDFVSARVRFAVVTVVVTGAVVVAGTGYAEEPGRTAFADLARTLGAVRDESVNALIEVDLDRDRRRERVALLCGRGADAAFLIEKDADHRWLIALDRLDGRSLIEHCDAEPRSPTWKQQKQPYLEVFQGHHHGGESFRIALRSDNPVVIWSESVDDNTRGDKPRIENYDKPNMPDYPQVESMTTAAYLLEVRQPMMAVLGAWCKTHGCATPFPPAGAPAVKPLVLRGEIVAVDSEWKQRAWKAALRIAGTIGYGVDLVEVRVGEPQPRKAASPKEEKELGPLNAHLVRGSLDFRFSFGRDDPASLLREDFMFAPDLSQASAECFDELDLRRLHVGNFVLGFCTDAAHGFDLHNP
jgi:hypothetical protein